MLGERTGGRRQHVGERHRIAVALPDRQRRVEADLLAVDLADHDRRATVGTRDGVGVAHFIVSGCLVIHAATNPRIAVIATATSAGTSTPSVSRIQTRTTATGPPIPYRQWPPFLRPSLS